MTWYLCSRHISQKKKEERFTEASDLGHFPDQLGHGQEESW